MKKMLATIIFWLQGFFVGVKCGYVYGHKTMFSKFPFWISCVIITLMLPLNWIVIIATLILGQKKLLAEAGREIIESTIDDVL